VAGKLGSSERKHREHRVKKKAKDKQLLHAAEPEAPKKPQFTLDMVKSGLSQLGKTADGLRPAYLKLAITHGTDMSSCRELAGYPDLQILMLANNELRDLSHLSYLPNLIHLDVANNKLTEVLNFKIFEGNRSNLRQANFAGNRITTLPDLSAFSRLTSLALDRNQIEVLHGLNGLSALNTLSLTHNKLRSIEGLEALCSLRHLNLKGNRLRSLQPLRPLAGLQTLDASHNQLASLEGAEGLIDLHQLDVTHNALPGLGVTGPCAKLAFLDRLDIMRGNPVAKVMGCRLHLVHLLPQVAVLDGMAVAPKEKVHAANMHGAAAEGLLAIRKKYFPRGELDDNGGTIPPPSAGLVAADAKEEASDPSGTRSTFLRIDACVRGIDVPSAQQQAAAAMLEALASQIANASCRPPTSTTTRDDQRPSRLGTPLPDQAGPPGTPLSVLSSRPQSTQPGQEPQQNMEATGGALLHVHSADRASGPSDALSVPPSGPALLALATELASVCEGQLQLARACFQWVAMHTDAPKGPGATARVDAPLFASEAQELLLLGYGDAAITGTWAERAAWLFVQLARACELEAVLISGFWKGDGIIRPGRPIAAHNHCWAGVKVNGQWRLLDPTNAALHKGRETPSAPFYIPPTAFIYAYYPLEDHWQLLPEPMSMARWWSLPHVSVGFLARGMVLLEALDLGHLRSVNTLPAPREGEELPTLQIRLAAPRVPGCLLRHSLRDSSTGQIVQADLVRPSQQQHQQGQNGFDLCCEHDVQQGVQDVDGLEHGVTEAGQEQGQQGLATVLWPPPLCGSRGRAKAEETESAARGALAFQQVEQVSVDSSPASHMVRFGASTCVSSPHALVASPPGPGEYELVVEHVLEVPGGMQVHLDGLDAPMVLRLEETEEVLCIKVVVPEIEPHDPEAGILHDTATPPCLLPYTHLGFIERRAQLVNPPPVQQLQADRTYEFQIVVPGARQVVLLLPDGRVLHHLSLPESSVQQQQQQQQPTPSESVAGAQGASRIGNRGEHPECWCGTVQAPRAPYIQLAMSESEGTRASETSAAAAEPSVQADGSAPGSEGGVPEQGNASSRAGTPAQGCMGISNADSNCSKSNHWLPLLTFRVAPQLQHMVDTGIEPEVPTIEPSQPSAKVAVELFGKMDLDQDGKVSRKDMLSAVRRDPGIARLLGLPSHISLADGTMDTFYEIFQSIDTSGLGTITFSELCMRLGIQPERSFGRLASTDDLEFEEEEEGEEEGEESEGVAY